MTTVEQENALVIPFPEYVIPTDHIDVRIGSLRSEAQLYDNYPDCQREKIWSYSLKRSLIDSILRGFPIPELLAHQKGQSLEIIDLSKKNSRCLLGCCGYCCSASFESSAGASGIQR
jgi:hypothetical protein